MSLLSRMCVNCDWREAIANKRCRACYEYLKRTGDERPRELIVKHGRQIADRLGVIAWALDTGLITQDDLAQAARGR
ncbi:MAG: hypothetical protein M3O70_08805 [Actinomycetota bacterium]|nr:hypothetical protein [Actinomycetota bacterium]